MDKGLSWDCADFWTQKEARNKYPQPDGLGCWWEVGGKSGGYWVAIARSRPAREAEARHSTKFGQHWAGSRPRPSGRSYTILRSPYDPAPGWNGRTAFPPRVGPAAPGRWPAEAPDGLRPYKYKEEQENASRAVTDRLRLSDDPQSYQRLRDHKAHLLERRRHSGSCFQDKAEPTAAQFARGVRWAELESIELYRRHDQLRWFIDAKFDDEAVSSAALARNKEHLAEDARAGNAPSGFVGRGLDSEIADSAGYGFEEVINTVERRRRKYGRPLRERRKAGRKPIGLIAQTTAERVRKHRRRKALKFKALATHERLPAGTVQPPPLGQAVPVPTFASTDEGSAMSELATLSVEAALSSASRNAEPTAGPRRYPADAAGHSGADIFAGLMAAYSGTPACLSRKQYTLRNSTQARQFKKMPDHEGRANYRC